MGKNTNQIATNADLYGYQSINNKKCPTYSEIISQVSSSYNVTISKSEVNYQNDQCVRYSDIKYETSTLNIPTYFTNLQAIGYSSNQLAIYVGAQTIYLDGGRLYNRKYLFDSHVTPNTGYTVVVDPGRIDNINHVGQIREQSNAAISSFIWNISSGVGYSYFTYASVYKELNIYFTT